MDLWSVEPKDDIASNVGHGDATEVAAELRHEFVVGRLVGLDIFLDVRDTKLIEPLHLGVAEGTPASAIHGDLRGCSTHGDPFVITIHCTVNDFVSKVTLYSAYATIMRKESTMFV